MRTPLSRTRGAPGYTLAELMLTVAIMGILMLVGPPLLNNMQNFFLMSSARTEIQRDARVCLDLINRLLREAQAASVIIDTPAGQGPNSRIRFRHVDGRYISFYQSGSQLIEQIGTTVTAISRNLSYIAFSYPHSDDTSIISVSVTMSKNIQLGRKKVLNLDIQKVRVMN